jgi:hypothetical protein
MPSRIKIKGNEATVTRAMTPAQQQQGCLRINNCDNTIMMRATIAIVMTEKTPVHRRQRRQLDDERRGRQR